jgi:hypothetical protein
MKIKILRLWLVIILLGFGFEGYSQAQPVLLNKSEYDSLKINYPRQDNPQEIFLVIDLNDCYNCNLGLINLTKNVTLNGKKVNLYIPNISTKKINSFVEELGISQSCILVSSVAVKTILNRLSKYTKASKSYVVFYDQSSMLQLTYLDYLSKEGSMKDMLNYTIKPKNKRVLNDGDIFYTSFSNGLTISENYVFISSPNFKLLVLDTMGRFKKEVSFSDSALIKIASEKILSRFHDSIRNNGFNTDENILNVYNQDIKPLKLPILKFTNMFYNKDTLFVSGSISLPITTEFEKIKFAPCAFIFKFDKELNFVTAVDYQIDLVNKLTPVDIYGFAVSGIEEIKLAVIDFNSKIPPAAFMGKWKLSSSGNYSFVDIDSAIKLPQKDSMEFYYRKKLGNLIYKYRTINDSLIAFNYYPFVINIRGAIAYPLINSCQGYECPFYASEWSTLVYQNNKSYYLSIERYLDVAFLSLYNSSYDRLISLKLNEDIQKSKLFFMKNQYTVEAVSFDEEGTVISDVDILPLLGKLQQ